MKVKITSDSTCDLSPELLEKYNIDLLPVTVTLGERDGKDMVDIPATLGFSPFDVTGVVSIPVSIEIHVLSAKIFY